jgi:lysophospholipase L1-like esterase
MTLASQSSTSIVFVGSSIMALWDNLPQVFPDIPCVNTAVSGSHTHEIAARLGELVIAYAPRLVCYYCGSNDINYGASAQTVVDNVVATYRTLRASLPDVKFAYLSIIKAPQKQDRWSVVEAANGLFKQLATQLPDFTFIDVNPLFLAANGQPRWEFYVEDQLHLTPAAYEAMGTLIGPSIRALFLS